LSMCMHIHDFDQTYTMQSVVKYPWWQASKKFHENLIGWCQLFGVTVML
jgi:hypothetical protein